MKKDIKSVTHYSKPDPFVVIVMEDSTKLRRQLSAVEVRLELVHSGDEFELKGNTAFVNTVHMCVYRVNIGVLEICTHCPSQQTIATR